MNKNIKRKRNRTTKRESERNRQSEWSGVGDKQIFQNDANKHQTFVVCECNTEPGRASQKRKLKIEWEREREGTKIEIREGCLIKKHKTKTQTKLRKREREMDKHNCFEHNHNQQTHEHAQHAHSLFIYLDSRMKNYTIRTTEWERQSNFQYEILQTNRNLHGIFFSRSIEIKLFLETIYIFTWICDNCVISYGLWVTYCLSCWN